MLLEEGLTAQGLRVDCAGTPDEALELAGRRCYDAILCDLNLTAGGVFVNGQDVAKRILAASGNRKPAIIYMTGDLVPADDGQRGPDAPRHLQKPFRISDVLAVLKEVIPVSTAGTLPN
jgi:CheY-like chemotaxis protein